MDVMKYNQVSTWTAVVTPLLEDYSIDFNALSDLLKLQAKHRMGLLILGSTGEALALSEQEKRQIVEFVCQQQLDIPVMVGVGGFQLETQLKWMTFCQDLGVDAFLLPTPMYAKPGHWGQVSWFGALLEHSQKPCMLYNVPSRTGAQLSAGVIASFHDHPNCWALKESSGDIDIIDHYGPHLKNIELFCGDDHLLPEFVPFGAKGLVSVIANLWPQAVKHYVATSLDQTIDIEELVLMQQAQHTLFSASNPIGVKYALFQMGRIKTAMVKPPLAMADLKERTSIDAINLQIEKFIQSLDQPYG